MYCEHHKIKKKSGINYILSKLDAFRIFSTRLIPYARYVFEHTLIQLRFCESLTFK